MQEREVRGERAPSNVRKQHNDQTSYASIYRDVSAHAIHTLEF
jgi:hypothetical protein